MIFITGLVIMLLVVFPILIKSPSLIVALVLDAFINRKGRNADARQTEVIRAIEMARLRMGVWTNRQAEVLGRGLNRAIKTSALGTRNLDLFGRPERRKIIEVQIERDVSGRNGASRGATHAGIDFALDKFV